MQRVLQPCTGLLWLASNASRGSSAKPHANVVAGSQESLAGSRLCMHLLGGHRWEMLGAACFTWVELLKVLTELVRAESGVVDREDLQGDDGSGKSPLER